MKVAENTLGPEVDAALARIAVGQLDYRDALRPEEQQKSENPQPDGDRAVRRDGGNHVQIHHRHHEQQNQVPTAEDALQMRLVDLMFSDGKSLSTSWLKLDLAELRSAAGEDSPCPLTLFADRASSATTSAVRSCWALASAGATSSNADRCLSMSASVCCTETVHCSSHQYGCGMTPRFTMPNQ